MALLHLDDALVPQESFIDRARGRELDARAIGPALRLWSRQGAMLALRNLLREIKPYPGNADVVFTGSGDFHHVAYLLIERAVENAAAPTTVLHFDNHPDWVRFRHGVHCGSWAASAARLKGVQRLITIGPCSKDIGRPAPKGADLRPVEDDRLELYPYRTPDGAAEIEICGRRWPSIQGLGVQAFDDYLMTRISTRDVYVTIDKDVLSTEDAITNWDQGQTRLSDMLTTLKRVSASHRIIGADIVGDWSPAVYGGGFASSLLKQGEALMDQPWRGPPPGHAHRVNEAANLRLLDLFEEIDA